MYVTPFGQRMNVKDFILADGYPFPEALKHCIKMVEQASNSIGGKDERLQELLDEVMSIFRGFSTVLVMGEENKRD